MRKQIIFSLFAIMLLAFSSCEFVEPNHVGVMMENYGKNGKADFSLQKGKVWTASPGTQLFQVPLYEQRADFEGKVLHMKTADNTEITTTPLYSYRVIESRAIDVVFDNKHIGSGGDFMKSVEDNILESKIYDIVKEESRRWKDDTLMGSSGSLLFEKSAEVLVREEFIKRGFELINFSCPLDFSKKVKDKIDQRNEVNTNVSVLDQKILEQKKQNELAELQAQELIIRSKGLTPEILTEMYIHKWNGVEPSTKVVSDGKAGGVNLNIPPRK